MESLVGTCIVLIRPPKLGAMTFCIFMASMRTMVTSGGISFSPTASDSRTLRRGPHFGGWLKRFPKGWT